MVLNSTNVRNSRSVDVSYTMDPSRSRENNNAGTDFSAGRLGVRHLQVFLMFLGMIIAYGLRVMMSVAIVAMVNPDKTNYESEPKDWSKDVQGNVLSSFLWGYIVTQIPCGYLANVWSARKLLFLGFTLNGLMSIAIPLLIDTYDWKIVVACRIVQGLGQGSLLPGVQTLLSRWVPPNERARLGTFAWAGAQLGTVFSMAISGWLADSRYFGWPSVFYFFGILALAWSSLFLLLGSDDPAQDSKISDAERHYIQTSFGNAVTSKTDEKVEKLRTPWKEILTSLPMWALIIVHCGQNWGFWLLLTEIPTYMSEVLGYDIKDNGNLSALPYLAMWLLSFPASWLSDFALRKGASRGSIRKVSNTVAHWGPGLALFALCFVGKDKTITITLLVAAVGLNAGSLCGYQINHIDLSPNFAGTMMSITNCVATIVAIYAPKICNWIVTEQNNIDQWHTVFYISTLVYFLGNLIFIIFGSGEVQWWNDPSSAEMKSGKRSYQIKTISTVYNPEPTNFKRHNSTELH